MADGGVNGAEQFFRLSKALKAAGRNDLRKELTKEMRTAARPLIPKARAEARRRLPSSGGLGKLVAKEPMRVQARTGRRTYGVRVVVGRKRGAARAANKGKIRHPVFGNRDVWVDQLVPPDWFDDPMRESAPDIRRRMERGMENVADKIVRGG